MRMGHRVHANWGLGLAGIALCVVSACRAQPAVDPAAPEYKVTASVQEIMLSMVDPNADVLWESVSTTVSAAGTEERQPRTPEDWAAVRRSAITIVEASNLLQMPGRHIAAPGVRSEYPGIELHPEEIEALVNQDRVAWKQRALGLHAAALTALTAIDAKNVPGLLEAGVTIDEACESCHLKYWYPNAQQPTEVSTVGK